MSGILDRLRRVEGLSSSGHAGARRGADALSPAPTGEEARSSEASPPESGVRTLRPTLLVLRVAVGLVLIFTVFILWRTWKGPVADRSASARGVAPARLPTGSVVADRPVDDTQPAPSREPHSVAPEKAGAVGPGTPFESVARVEPQEEQPTIAPPESPPVVEVPQASAASPQTAGLTEATGPPSGEVPSPGAPSAPDAASEAASPPPPEEAMASPPVREILTPEEDEKTKSFLLKLRISGVYKDADGYVALINGRQCEKGHTFGKIELVQITSERVTFAYQGKRYHLPIR